MSRRVKSRIFVHIPCRNHTTVALTSVLRSSHADEPDQTHLSHCPSFVVATDQLYTVWPTKFEADEQRDGLDGEESSVNVIAWTEFSGSYMTRVITLTKKEIVCMWCMASYAEDLDKIVELSS
jgi:hypothetical protein